MGSRPVAQSREAFALFRPLQTRWADNDCYGHMNNVVHYQLFDTAINAYLIEQGLLDIANGEIIGLVVRTECDYFSELAFPQQIEAGIAISRLGASTIAYRIGLFQVSQELAAAQGEFIHVYVDAKTRKPVALPPVWRSTLGVLER